MENFIKIIQVPVSEKGKEIHITENPSQLLQVDWDVFLLILDEKSPPALSLPVEYTILQVTASLCPEDSSLLSENEYTLYLAVKCPKIKGCISGFAFVRLLPFSRAKLYVQSKILTQEELVEISRNEERE